MNSSASCYGSNNNSPVHCQSSAHAQFSPSPTSHAPSLSPLSTTPGSVPGTPTALALDMKRILAKPAPPYAYQCGQSVGSSSESEGLSDSFQQKTSPVDRGAVAHTVGRSRSLQSLLDYRKGRQINATMPEKDDNHAQKKKERRPRNVLRRRPSTSSQLQNQKSPPFPLPPLHSPLPPLSPCSPLTPSMFPAGSTSSPSVTLGSTPRQTTAPSSSSRSDDVYPTRSVSSFDKMLPLSSNLEENPWGPWDRPFGSGPAQVPKNEGDTEECVVSVTDEKGKKVNPRVRLRELKGHPFPSSSSPSPSRSHPASPNLYCQPYHLSAPSSLNGRSSSSSRSRSHSRNPRSAQSEASSDPSTILTPAAAVVVAYKRQEDMNKTSHIMHSSIDVDISESRKDYRQLGMGKKMKRPYTSSGHGCSATESQPFTSAMDSKLAPSEEGGGKYRPYYTVFGTASDHVVAAGGPKDRHHLSYEIVPPFTLSRKRSDGGDGGGLRTLTRKMSGRFKRVVNGTQSEGEEERQRVSLHNERERGRQSFQERSRTGTLFGKGEKGGLSVVKPGEEKDTTLMSAPSPSSGGSKIWKLMKRLSTGALREKFVNAEVPPVPSLPKEYVVPDPTRPFDPKTEVMGTLPLTEGFSKAVRKKASVILGVKVTSNCGLPIKPLIPSSSLASQVPAPVIRPSLSLQRPYITTRSSSSVSSDVASSRFFTGHKPSSMSAHSSTSSLPIEDNSHPPPPLPPCLSYNDSDVGQPIVPPSELGKVHVQSDDGQRHGYGRSEASLTSSLPGNSTIQSPRNQMKLRLVVPTTPVSPLETHHDHDNYTMMHMPLAVEMESLSLPPRRLGFPLSRVRRDTYASLTAEVGQDQDGEHEEDEEVVEHMKEWQWLWRRGSNSSLNVDEKKLDSRSGSPLIPSFSIEDPINTFSPKRTSTASRRNSKPSPSTSFPSIIYHYPPEPVYVPSPAESLPLPPRPARSLQRPASNPTQSNRSPLYLDSR